MDTLLEEINNLFKIPLRIEHLARLSEQLQLEYHGKLQSSEICMLPSYLHALPSGQETGNFLALDQGGSNFRVALIELRGNHLQQAGMHVKPCPFAWPRGFTLQS